MFIAPSAPLPGPVGTDRFSRRNMSRQICRVQVDDPYPRMFGLSGVLTMPKALWDQPSDGLLAWLEMEVGAGQVTHVLRLNLRSMTDAQLGGIFLPIDQGSDPQSRAFSGFGFPAPAIVARALACRLVLAWDFTVDIPAAVVGLSIILSNISGGRV